MRTAEDIRFEVTKDADGRKALKGMLFGSDDIPRLFEMMKPQEARSALKANRNDWAVNVVTDAIMETYEGLEDKKIIQGKAITMAVYIEPKKGSGQ